MIDHKNARVIELYFTYLDIDRRKLIDIIDSCITKKGVAIDQCIVYAFAEEYMEYDEGYFGDSGLKISMLEPLMDEDREEVYSIEEFLSYVFKYYNKNIMYYSSSDRKLIESKLDYIKNSYNI